MGYSGQDIFYYIVNDGDRDSEPASVRLTTVEINHPPLAHGDVFTTSEDAPLLIANGGVLANDHDSDGNPLSAVLITDTHHGMLNLDPEGTFFYTPTDNYFGLDSFYYRAFDGHQYSDPVEVRLNITAVNDRPVGFRDYFTVTSGLPLTVTAPGVLVNDFDVDDESLIVFINQLPLHGRLILYPTGAFVYTPEQGYSGSDVFWYQVWDGELATSPIQVTFSVIPVEEEFSLCLPLIIKH
jgi:hypothetical protein